MAKKVYCIHFYRHDNYRIDNVRIFSNASKMIRFILDNYSYSHDYCAKKLFNFTFTELLKIFEERQKSKNIVPIILTHIDNDKFFMRLYSFDVE